MLAATLCLLLGHTSDPNRLAVASDEAKLLAQHLGLRIEVSAPLSREVLFLRGSLPPTQELAAVAEALHATVLHLPNGITIQRTSADLAGIRAARRKQREDWIHSALDLNSTSRKQQGTSPGQVLAEAQRVWKAWDDFQNHRAPYPAGVYTVRYALPGENLLEGILGKLGIAKVAAIPTGEDLVYETHPVLDAQPLPDISDLLVAYEAAARQFEAVQLTDQFRKQIDNWVDFDLVKDAAKAGTPPADVRLRISANYLRIGISLELYDSTGRRQDGADLTITARGSYADWPSIQMEADKKPAAHFVQLSAESAAAAKFPATTPASLPDWFIHPDKREPLDLFVRDAVAGLTDEGADNCVVVDVSDSFWGLARTCVQNGKLGVSGFKALVSQADNYERLADGPAVVWRPVDPEEVEAQRANRRTLASYAQQVVTDGGVSPRVSGELYHEGFPATWFLTRVWPDSAFDAMGQANTRGGLTPRFYALIGAIPEPYWEQLLAGRTITAGEAGITRELQELLKEDRVKEQGQNRIPDLYKHPAELYADSDLNATPISFRGSSLPAMARWSPDQPELDLWTSAAGPIRLGMPEVSLDNPPKILETQDEFEQRVDQMFRLRFATLEFGTLVVGLPHGLYLEGGLPAIPEDRSGVEKLSELPKETRDQIWQAACQRSIAYSLGLQERMRGPQPGAPAIIPPSVIPPSEPKAW